MELPNYLKNLPLIDGFSNIEYRDKEYKITFFYDEETKILFYLGKENLYHQVLKNNKIKFVNPMVPETFRIFLKSLFVELYKSIKEREKIYNLLEKRHTCDYCGHLFFYEKGIVATNCNFYRPLYKFCKLECLKKYEIKKNVEIEVF